MLLSGNTRYSSLIIRKANLSDLDDIHQIETQSFPDPWPKFLFSDMLGHPQQRLFLAKIQKDIAGYIAFWKMVDEVHILNICVDQAHRRQGIARGLLTFCMDFYPEEDVRYFLLEVRASNQIAQKFYKSFGFEEKYVRQKYYPNGEDAIVMILQN